jgi:hypothetical protein
MLIFPRMFSVTTKVVFGRFLVAGGSARMNFGTHEGAACQLEDRHSPYADLNSVQ